MSTKVYGMPAEEWLAGVVGGAAAGEWLGRDAEETPKQRKPRNATRPYMGDPKATHVSLLGCLWRKEKKAPFTTSGFSVQGGVEYCDADDTWKCHECGEWHHALLLHVSHRHRDRYATAKDYKRAHLLCAQRGFTSKKARGARARNLSVARQCIRKTPIAPAPDTVRRALQIRMAIDPSARLSGEMMNLQGRCKQQTLHDLRSLGARLRRTPTCDELDSFINADGHRTLRHSRLKRIFGSMTNALALCGMRPRNQGAPKANKRISFAGNTSKAAIRAALAQIGEAHVSVR